MMGIRFVAAGSILFLFVRLRGAPMPTLKQWRSAGIIGGLLLVGGMGSVAMAEQWVSSGLVATLVATAPVVTMMIGMFWGSRPRRAEWIGVALGILGVALLTLEGNLQANPGGLALVMFATLSWSLGSVWSKHLDLPPGIMGSAAEMLLGGAALVLLGLLRGEQITGAPTTLALVSLIHLTTFGSLAAITAYMYLLKTVKPSLALSYAFVNPAIALGLGVLIGGEQITGTALISCRSFWRCGCCGIPAKGGPKRKSSSISTALRLAEKVMKRAVRIAHRPPSFSDIRLAQRAAIPPEVVAALDILIDEHEGRAQPGWAAEHHADRQRIARVDALPGAPIDIRTLPR
jgi:drug/metabolite transporter (DMT)-like permease